MGEVAKATAKAQVYFFTNGQWSPSNDGGLSTVGLYENTSAGTYRVVAASDKVAGVYAINSSIVSGIDYQRPSDKFGQWTSPGDGKTYGLNFQSPDEALNFGNNMDTVLAALGGGKKEKKPKDSKKDKADKKEKKSDKKDGTIKKKKSSAQENSNASANSAAEANTSSYTAPAAPAAAPVHAPAPPSAPPAAPPHVPPHAPPHAPAPPAAPAAPHAVVGGGGPPPPPPPPPPARSTSNDEDSGSAGGGGLAAALAGAKLKKVAPPKEPTLASTMGPPKEDTGAPSEGGTSTGGAAKPAMAAPNPGGLMGEMLAKRLKTTSAARPREPSVGSESAPVVEKPSIPVSEPPMPKPSGYAGLKKAGSGPNTGGAAKAAPLKSAFATPAHHDETSHTPSHAAAAFNSNNAAPSGAEIAQLKAEIFAYIDKAKQEILEAIAASR